MKTVYVGNLPYSITEEDVAGMISKYAKVFAVKLVTNRRSGRPRGFGFVQINDDALNNVVSSLNGAAVEGRSLKVLEATSEEQS